MQKIIFTPLYIVVAFQKVLFSDSLLGQHKYFHWSPLFHTHHYQEIPNERYQCQKNILPALLILLYIFYPFIFDLRTTWSFSCKFADPAVLFPPRKTHFNPNGNGKPLTLPFFNKGEYLPTPPKWKTVRNAIADLPLPEGTEIRNVPPPLDLHFGRNPTELSRKRYRAIPQEWMNRFDLQRVAPELTPQCWIRKKSGGTDLFGRLWWDRPSVTIHTEFFKPEKGRYLHPEQHRPITHREAARFLSAIFFTVQLKGLFSE